MKKHKFCMLRFMWQVDVELAMDIVQDLGGPPAFVKELWLHIAKYVIQERRDTKACVLPPSRNFD